MTPLHRNVTKQAIGIDMLQKNKGLTSLDDVESSGDEFMFGDGEVLSVLNVLCFSMVLFQYIVCYVGY